jgi:energy-coupling factor transporter ATP-binding protein EcfA2
MQLEIQHCNNLDFAHITIAENKLNIKFAPNGTGKSTIARAIQYYISENGNTLDELTPFKLRVNNPNGVSPEVKGAEQISAVMCFNEDYVNNITFRPDELISDSFDVFVKNDIYQRLEQDIEHLMQDIRSLFLNNQELESLISKLKELGGAFTLTKAGISKASTGMKGLAKGNKIQHVPAGLELFSPFIQSDKNVNWIDWQIKGYDYADLSDNCPFCTSDTTDKKEQIKKIGEEYSKATIKNLVGLIDVIRNLGEYFSEDTRSQLATITTLKDGLENEHRQFLVNIKNQIDTFTQKLEKLRMLSGYDFKHGEKVADQLCKYKLDLEFFPGLNSDKIKATVESINSSISSLMEKSGDLQGKINQLRKKTHKVIQKHQNDINNFLMYAGYKYKVEIAGDEGQSQLKLLHCDFNTHLSGGRQYLSFGERNAFAMVLFMYECLAKSPSLIILDDPISSFDKHKKYAILEMLFRKDANLCLKGKTVLMLTHDVEPVIDTIKAVRDQFQNQITASFLKYELGVVSEVFIEEDDIQTFLQVCENALQSDKDDIIKVIYLRRLLEIKDKNSDEYQVLSNLVHKRPRLDATDKREPKNESNKYPIMEGSRFESGCHQIENYINGFNYDVFVSKVSSETDMKELYSSCNNSYEKLQIFRLFDIDVNNSVIQKFINETYHVENEFICQLNPEKFDTIPAYVVEICNNGVA